MNVALVPIKRLSMGKSRLRPTLDGETLEALTLAMLEDVLEALGEVPAIGRVAVVTPDTRVAERARGAGAEALLRPDPGLNESIEAAAAELELAADDALLVVLGDVAGARAEDFDALLAAAAETGPPCAVLAPSRDGGSSALLRDPHDAVPARFGRDSALRHREAAAAGEVGWQELALPRLAVDLDRPDDVAEFLESDSGGPRTRALLASLGWGEPT